ncbi:hypothetical protein GCM10027299_21020 [Larkinella ripae]
MKTIPVLLLLLVVLACNRKDDEVILARGQSVRLIRHDYYGNPANPAAVESTQYVYDPTNRIQEIISNRTDGSLDSKLVFRWLSPTTLRVEQYYTNPPWSSTRVSNLPLKLYSYSETFYKTDTTIQERKNYLVTDNKADFRSSSQFTYDAQKRISRRDIYDTNNRLASSVTFTYDQRGNLIQASGDQATYEYDTAPNPYKPVRIDTEISWFMSSNNIVKMRAADPTTGAQEETRYRYEYRPDGYPTRMIYPDGRKEEFTYNQ